MFGTAIEQLEDSIDQIAAAIRSIEDVDVAAGDATDTVLRMERLRERFEAAIGCLVSDLEARGAHERDSAYSMANWLAARTGMRRATAGSRAHLARTLRAMPATAEALGEGEITASHASVLKHALNPRTAEAFARDEGVLVESARKLTADQLVQVVEFWLRHHDPDGSEPDSEDRDRFWLSQTLDGRLKGNFDLGGDLASVSTPPSKKPSPRSWPGTRSAVRSIPPIPGPTTPPANAGRGRWASCANGPRRHRPTRPAVNP